MSQNSVKTEFKMPFLRRFIMSLKDIDKYDMISKVTIGNSIKYLFILIIIFSVIITAVFITKISQLQNQLVNYIENDLPNFKIENTEFHIDSEEPIIKETDDYLELIITLTNSDDNEAYQKVIDETQDKNIIVIMKDRIIYKDITTLTSNAVMFSDFAKINNEENLNVTKEQVVDYIKTLNPIYYSFTVFIALVISYLMFMVLNMFIIFIVGYILSKIVGVKLTPGNIFNIVSSSVTLSTLLSIIFFALIVLKNYTMPYFNLLYMLLSYIYITAAFMVIKSNDKIIKNQAVVGKINNKDEKDEEKDDIDDGIKLKDKNDKNNDTDDKKNTPKRKRRVKSKGDVNPAVNIK